MTRYTVVWSPEAEARLAEIWMNFPDHQAIADAANAMDRLLAVDPATHGSPLSEGLRSLDVPPLHVLFFIQEDDRLVRVVLVRRQNPQPPPADGNGQAAP